MRRAVSLVLSISLTLAGAYVLIGHLLFADTIRGVILMAAGLMIGLGSYWFWADFMGGEPRSEERK